MSEKVNEKDLSKVSGGSIYDYMYSFWYKPVFVSNYEKASEEGFCSENEARNLMEYRKGVIRNQYAPYEVIFKDEYVGKKSSGGGECCGG